MSDWYRLDLGDMLESSHRIGEIQNAFRPIYLRTPAGSGRALVYRYNEIRNIGEMFFTPPNRDLALALGATCCAKPTLGEGRLVSVMGDEDTSTLFPEQERF